MQSPLKLVLGAASSQRLDADSSDLRDRRSSFVFVVSVSLLVAYTAACNVPFTGWSTLSVLVKIGLMVGAIDHGRAVGARRLRPKWWFAHEFIIEDVMTAQRLFAAHLLSARHAYYVAGEQRRGTVHAGVRVRGLRAQRRAVHRSAYALQRTGARR